MNVGSDALSNQFAIAIGEFLGIAQQRREEGSQFSATEQRPIRTRLQASSLAERRTSWAELAIHPIEEQCQRICDIQEC